MWEAPGLLFLLIFCLVFGFFVPECHLCFAFCGRGRKGGLQVSFLSAWRDLGVVLEGGRMLWQISWCLYRNQSPSWLSLAGRGGISCLTAAWVGQMCTETGSFYKLPFVAQC